MDEGTFSMVEGDYMDESIQPKVEKSFSLKSISCLSEEQALKMQEKGKKIFEVSQMAANISMSLKNFTKMLTECNKSLHDVKMHFTWMNKQNQKGELFEDDNYKKLSVELDMASKKLAEFQNSCKEIMKERSAIETVIEECKEMTDKTLKDI